MSNSINTTFQNMERNKTKKNKDTQGLPYQISVNIKGLSVIYLKKSGKEAIK